MGYSSFILLIGQPGFIGFKVLLGFYRALLPLGGSQIPFGKI